MHPVYATISIILSTVGFAPYAYAIYRRTARPHFFTWFIWTIVTILVFIAQMTSGAGLGAWTTGAIAAMCAVAAVASIYRGETSRTRFDWACLAIALISIPVWYVTGNPTLSVILLTFIELIGFGPTIRKSLIDPYSENALYYFLCGLKYLFGALALDQWNIATACYPVTICITAFAFFTLLMMRRSSLRKAGQPILEAPNSWEKLG